MKKLDPFLDLGARILLALIFVVSGLGKTAAFEATQGYMEAFGIQSFFLAPTIAFEILAGIAIMMGYKVRIVALLLASFSIITAAVFHSNFADQIQMIMFLKNVSIAGGLLLLARNGVGAYSVDGRVSV